MARSYATVTGRSSPTRGSSVIEVNIYGLQELQTAIKKLNADLATRGIRNAVAAGARVIKKDAHRRAQVIHDKEVRKNKYNTSLPAAIYVKGKKDLATPTTYTYVVGARNGRGRKGIKQLEKGNSAYYWWWVENGHNTKKGHVAAQPFIRPAYEEKKYEAAMKIRENLHKFIMKHNNNTAII